MLNSNQLKLVVVSIVTLTLSGFLFYQGLNHNSNKVPDQQLSSNYQPEEIQKVKGENAASDSAGQNFVKVVRVVDGDTIEVNINGVTQKLRYIGVNTPETVDPKRSVQCFGKEASNENKRLLEGKNILLEKDVSETDKYGRLLRYVYLRLDDGTTLFVNDYLVREGFAQVNTFPPDVKYQERFLEAQKEARENNKGLWAKCK